MELPQRAESPILADTLILGAGLSGLSTALNLVEKCKHVLRVIIIEARDRVGGRTMTARIDIEPAPGFVGVPSVDLGGQWVGPKQARVLRLVKEFGLTLVEQEYPSTERGLAQGLEALVECVGYENPPLDEDAVAEFKAFVSGLEPLLEDMDPAAPWDYPRAEEFDNISVADYVREHVRVIDISFFTS
jgi:monoamine oxidase